MGALSDCRFRFAVKVVFRPKPWGNGTMVEYGTDIFGKNFGVKTLLIFSVGTKTLVIAFLQTLAV